LDPGHATAVDVAVGADDVLELDEELELDTTLELDAKLELEEALEVDSELELEEELEVNSELELEETCDELIERIDDVDETEVDVVDDSMSSLAPQTALLITPLPMASFKKQLSPTYDTATQFGVTEQKSRHPANVGL
jgi:hypothetical protein